MVCADGVWLGRKEHKESCSCTIFIENTLSTLDGWNRNRATGLRKRKSEMKEQVNSNFDPHYLVL